MDRDLRVRTPESVAFSYELAGLGSRFLAVVIDLAVQLGILAAIVWGLSLLASHDRTPPKESVSDSIVTAIVIAILFLVFFGYFIVFEALWNGQTPGKRALGIRVVRDGGYPIDFGSSLIRNLVRIGEMALGFYAVSAVATLASADNKRLGDFAAGTIVVRDAPILRAEDFVTASAGAPKIPVLSDEERKVITEFVSRRTSMADGPRARMARQLANLVRPRVERGFARLDDETLLRLLTE